MPLPGHIANSGLYCANCNQPKLASELRRLFVKWKPSDREPNQSFKYRNHYCEDCLPRIKEQLLARGAVDFREDPVIPVTDKERQL